jgi:adenine phosphoribosyltransferase
MNKEKLIKSIRNIPDFPISGIQFKDVTTLFKDTECLQILSDMLYDTYKNKGITKVVAIESRGFIMAPILATRLNAGFIPIRKPGKLPAETIEITYDKEYGTDTIQMHKDAIDNNDRILLHDDLLATGGTMKAAYELVKILNPKSICINFIIEMEELKGRAVFDKNIQIESILKL